MLQELIELWPGGPSIALGTYFVYFKYLFSLLVAVVAVGTFYWPRRAWMVSTTLALAALAIVTFDRPLARPYGLADEGRVVEDLAHVMVTTTRGGVDGRLVGAPNPHPLWGRMVAAVSGFDAGRLWALYRWLPLLSMLVLAAGVVGCAGGLEQHPVWQRGSLGGLTVFFVLFLSSHRLSFLEPESTLWSQAFLTTPELGVALAGVCLCLRWLPGESMRESMAAAVALAFVGWIEPRLAWVLATGAGAWVLVYRRWRPLVAIAAGVVLVVPFRPAPAPIELPEGFASWHDAFGRLLSVSFDLGLVFLLAVVGVRFLLRSKRSTETLLGTCTIAAVALWSVATLMPAVATALGPGTIKASVLVLLSMSAAYGLYRGLALYPELPQSWSFVSERVRRHGGPRLALPAFLMLSLPWCLPYWWMPVRMDPTYAASVAPLSGNLFAMADAIREHADRDAVFVAGPSYAPWIPALTGRRVLLAGDSMPDYSERDESQNAFLSSRNEAAIADAADRWDLTHVAWGRLDQPGSDVELRFFEQSPLFEERFRLRRWVSLFEYTPR